MVGPVDDLAAMAKQTRYGAEHLTPLYAAIAAATAAIQRGIRGIYIRVCIVSSIRVVVVVGIGEQL